MLELIDVEKLEQKYLNKFYYFLKYAEDEMLEGFKTKNDIIDDWIHYWSADGHSDFDVGAERIVYALFNGKGIGTPNSSPVGADLFFETRDAYIHIDMKTVEASGNIGDYATSIFVGENQNSYRATIMKQGGNNEEYIPSLPPYYNHDRDNEKICLSYFITILYEKVDIKILNINILSMPNGSLSEVYGSRPLKAGKNPGKARFNFMKTHKFELLSNSHPDMLDAKNSRIKVVYFNLETSTEYASNLEFLRRVYAEQANINI